MPFYFSASRIIRHSDEVRLGRKAMCIADIVSDHVYTAAVYSWTPLTAGGGAHEGNGMRGSQRESGSTRGRKVVVTRAQAGGQVVDRWIPACAGM